jgi:hypothetical protein
MTMRELELAMKTFAWYIKYTDSNQEDLEILSKAIDLVQKHPFEVLYVPD